jgi:DNA-binding transcriptional LysR family regulator
VGPAREVLEGRADLAIINLPHHIDGEPDLVTGTIGAEPFVLVHPASRPDVAGLPVINWDENCDASTCQWWKTQDWLSEPSSQVADDSVLLSMVGHGMGMAVVPYLTSRGAPDTVAVRDLGPDGPKRTIGYVTTPELARSAVVRALIRELRGQAI